MSGISRQQMALTMQAKRTNITTLEGSISSLVADKARYQKMIDDGDSEFPTESLENGLIKLDKDISEIQGVIDLEREGIQENQMMINESERKEVERAEMARLSQNIEVVREEVDEE